MKFRSLLLAFAACFLTAVPAVQAQTAAEVAEQAKADPGKAAALVEAAVKANPANASAIVEAVIKAFAGTTTQVEVA